MKSGKKSREKMKLARMTEVNRFKHDNQLIDDQIIAERVEHDFRMSGLAVNQLQTVFHVREAQYEVDKRINAAREPLHRVRTNSSDQLIYYTHDRVINMPIRPDWNKSMTAEQINTSETAYFDTWLNDIYAKHTPYQLNHFEHNLDVWRQLWRTVESSDILCVCVDSRHPLFHYPPSLHAYITQVHKKQVIVVMNKIDLIYDLTLQQWLTYFNTHYSAITVVPFTSYPNNTPSGALPTQTDSSSKQLRQNKRANWRPLGTESLMKLFDGVLQDKLSRRPEDADNEQSAAHDDVDLAVEADKLTIDESKDEPADELPAEPAQYASMDAELAAEDSAYKQKMANVIAKRKAKKQAKQRAKERRKQHIGDESDDDDADSALQQRSIVDWRKRDSTGDAEDGMYSDDDDPELPSWRKQTKLIADRSLVVRVGLLGHPNAGKSSVLNALLNRHATSVSETPGKTKHMQTFNLTSSIELADSPGLVFPACDMPKQLQCICGLFPLKQLREPYSSVQYVAERVDLVSIYQLQPPADDDNVSASKSQPFKQKKKAQPGDDSDMFSAMNDVIDSYAWSAWDICEAYARKHSMRVSGSKGVFDTHRAAVQILQDTFNGVVVLSFDCPADDGNKQLNGAVVS